MTKIELGVLSREVRRYSRDDLRSRVMAAGFSVERMTYAFASLFPAMAIARAWQRWRGLKREDEDAARLEISIPGPPLNTLLTAAVMAEAACIRRFDMPFGSSLICLARKPEQ